MTDERMQEMRLRRMAERQGLLLEKARKPGADQAAKYHLIRGSEVPGGAANVDLDEVERQLMKN
jgi:hypothetical protein